MEQINGFGNRLAVAQYFQSAKLPNAAPVQYSTSSENAFNKKKTHDAF